MPVSLNTMSSFAAFKKHLKSFLFTKYCGEKNPVMTDRLNQSEQSSEILWFRTIMTFIIIFILFLTRMTIKIVSAIAV